MLIIITTVIIIINYFSLMTVCPPITEIDPIVLPNCQAGNQDDHAYSPSVCTINLSINWSTDSSYLE